MLHVIDVLRSTLKSQRIELRFVQQDTETILDNKPISNVYIPRDIHRRFAYGEEVERMAISVAYSSSQEDIEVMSTTDANVSAIDIDGHAAWMGDIIWGCDNPTTDDVENFCRTMGGDNSWCESFEIDSNDTFEPSQSGAIIRDDEIISPPVKGGAVVGSVIGFVLLSIGGAIGGIIRAIGGLFAGISKDRMKTTNESQNDYSVYSLIFAPAEVKCQSHMLVQVYLHLYEETKKVKSLAQESDKNAERRDFIPLQCKLKKGDKVDVLLNMYGETLLMSDKKRVVWQGSFTKCCFDYFVPKDVDEDELSCVALLSVNGVPVSEMRFITKIVDAPRQLNPEILAHKYSKVFISYSHQDESKVKFLHEGLELSSVPHFFDRKYLKAGDVFSQVIQDYINSADLFIFCWSENASKSEYVQKELLNEHSHR